MAHQKAKVHKMYMIVLLWHAWHVSDLRVCNASSIQSCLARQDLDHIHQDILLEDVIDYCS